MLLEQLLLFYTIMPEPKLTSSASHKIKKAFYWIAWMLVVQFVLMNISAIFYASRLTNLKDTPPPAANSQSRNIFQRTFKLFTGPHLYRLPIKEEPVFPFDTVQLHTKNGITIHAWYGKQDSAAKGTVILFHGVTSNKAAILPEANEFRYWGYRVLLVDFRAHGLSKGSITTYGIKEIEEVKLAYDYILSKGEKRIILWGISMGAVSIAKSVAEYDLHPSGIILEAPFSSLEKHFKGRARTMGFPTQPFGWLVTRWTSIIRGVGGVRHQTNRYANRIHCPTLLQWGRLDTYVQKAEMESIFHSLSSPQKRLVVYNNTGHESMAQRETTVWRNEVSDFLQSLAP